MAVRRLCGNTPTMGKVRQLCGELAPPPHGEPEGAPPGIRAVYFANGGIMELNKSGFYPQPERHDGVLSAVIAGFVAGVTATITMLKLVR